MLLRTLPLWVGLLLAPSAARGQSPPPLDTHETAYYIVHTDLRGHDLQEAVARITRMGEEYYQRTRAFAGRITEKFDFYLVSSPRDYYALGGMQGSAGMYDPNTKRLMAVTGRRATPQTWATIQHEGFHQFAHNVIGGEIPIWVNEGLAEYFGEAIFTGDDYVSGVIPPQRLARLKAAIRSDALRPLSEMLALTHAAWNVEMSLANYDQAWSMVHFLAHAENERYQGAFAKYMKDISRGMKSEHAWRNNFGRGTIAFERKWKAYWLNLPDNPTAEKYAEATVARLTSFLARAHAQRQMFQSVESFFQAAEAGRLKAAEEDWLPPALLEEALRFAPRLGKWALRRGGRPQLICTLEDGTRVIGEYKLSRTGRVDSASVKVRTVSPR